MKSFVAFVAHCAELGENQRVVVVGECPELGGWDLGGALCMRPAPCGRPLWVSSEVEVDLSESPFGASGVSAYGMGMRGESGGVGLGVSELKFRLVAIPNEADAVTVSDPLHLICLEPLKGGDFRVVRLLDGVAPVDSSLVGARGVNIIHVGAKGGGEQQQNPEVVGISVEWGIPESVQLGLLPLHPNRHTEHPQKESEHAGLSGPQSETACPPSAQRRAQPDSRRFEPTDENEDKSAVSVCHHQSAVKFTESGGQGGGEGGTNRPRETMGPNKQAEAHVCSDSPDAAQEVCIRPADLKSHNRILPSPPSNSSDLQLSSHDRTCHRRHETEGEGAHSSGVALKRQRSEGALCQVEADDCDHVSGCPGERHGGASSGGGSGSSCLREEKQRRLTVSIPEFAPLSSECSRGRGDPVARGRAVVSGKGCLEREGEGGEVQRDVGVGSDRTRRAFTGEVKRDGSGNILCPHGRVRCRCRECGGKSFCEHGRQRSKCKDCGGKSICEHGRIRSTCKDCGGKSVCEHGRQRVQCKECGGKSICEHGRRRCQCKECGGKSVCEHGRRRSQCKECGGKSVCEHGRLRNRCKECGGKSVCEHRRRRSQCKECGGKSICEHGRERYYCKDCGGNGICVHRKHRRHCQECKLLSVFQY